LYINFFQPSSKLIAKKRMGNKTVKRYDPARRPINVLANAKTFFLETTPVLRVAQERTKPSK